MTDRIGVGKTGPATDFWLEADVVGYNVAGGFATLHTYLRAANGGGGSSGSQYNGAGFQAGYVDNAEFGRVSGNPFLPGGYGQGAQRWRHGPWTVNVPMSGQRNVGLSMWLNYGGVNEWYGGSVWVPWAPAAPNSVAVDQITPTSARYRFSGNSDNGSPVTTYQAQIATNTAFTQGVQTIGTGLGGVATFTNLTPATRYYFRSRGQNGVGWGAWSNTGSGTTASGAYVSQNGVWVPVPVYVSNGSSWVVPELLISNGTAWRGAI